MKTITRAEGGTEQREVVIDKIQVPDLWHIALDLKAIGKTREADMTLECWYLCHDLLKHLRKEGRMT